MLLGRSHPHHRARDRPGAASGCLGARLKGSVRGKVTMMASRGSADGAESPGTRRVEFTNSRGESLVGILTEAESSTDKAVILCHGYASTKNGFQLPKLAAALSAAGFNSLRFDFAGNGESTGTFRFGNYYDEVDDIHRSKQYLESSEGQKVVGLVGHSKGGNDVLLYASEHDDIPLVVNVSGRLHMAAGVMQRFGEDIVEQLKQGPKPITVTRSDGSLVEWELTLPDLQVRLALDMAAAVAKIQRSKVLTIHGSADAVIPVEDGQQYAELIQGSELVVVEGADHNYRGDPAHADAMIKGVVDFLLKH